MPSLQMLALGPCRDDYHVGNMDQRVKLLLHWDSEGGLRSKAQTTMAADGALIDNSHSQHEKQARKREDANRHMGEARASGRWRDGLRTMCVCAVRYCTVLYCTDQPRRAGNK